MDRINCQDAHEGGYLLILAIRLPQKSLFQEKEEITDDNVRGDGVREVRPITEFQWKPPRVTFFLERFDIFSFALHSTEAHVRGTGTRNLLGNGSTSTQALREIRGCQVRSRPEACDGLHARVWRNKLV